MKPSDLAAIILALGEMKYVHPQFLKAIDFYIWENVDKFNVNNLTMAVKGFGYLKVSPSIKMLGRVSSETMGNMEDISFPNLADLVLGFKN